MNIGEIISGHCYPDIHHINYNSFQDLEWITENTACVVVETIQAEAGIIAPDPKWILALIKNAKRKAPY